MNVIALMKEEHKYIKWMLAVIRKLCVQILDGAEVDFESFYKATDFIRNYADKHHHNKEEDILFNKMEEALQRVKEGDRDARVDVIANAVLVDELEREAVPNIN